MIIVKKIEKMKILIVNVHSSENAGDLALLQQTINYLQLAFGDTIISISSNWPLEKPLKNLGFKVVSSPWNLLGVWNKNKKPRYQLISFVLCLIYFYIFKFSKLINKQPIIPSCWSILFEEYWKSDLIVAVSGNQLFSSGKFGWPLPIIGFPIFLAFNLHKPIIIFPQSIGPFRYFWEEKYINYLYNRVNKLFIRDFVSLELATKLGIRKSIPQFIPDIAFTYPSIDPISAKNILENYGFSDLNKYIGITILSKMPSYMDKNNINHYYKEMAETISNLISLHQYKIFVFNQVSGPTEDENDLLGAKIVLSLIPVNIRHEIMVIEEKLNPSELKGCYGQMDVFLATRLHSGIFALDMRVPTLFIGYLDKTIGVLRSIELDEFYIDLKDVTSDKLTDKLLFLDKHKDKIISMIDEKLNSVVEKLNQFPELIKDTLSNEKN
jgi:colanic acid/amylovoran biosynthesis protein